MLKKAILKLRLRATLEFGIFLPPLQLPNLMAKASMDRYHYLPKKDPEFPTPHTGKDSASRESPALLGTSPQKNERYTHEIYNIHTDKLAISSACDRLTLTV